MKITEEHINRAKNLNLPDLFRNKNINLISTNNGSSFKCCCPFHEDKTPSLNINFKDNVWLWNCFGCGIGGSSIDFVMKSENLDFKEAVKRLVPETLNLSQVTFPKIELKPKPTPKETAKRVAMLNMVANHYHSNLTNGKGEAGKEYLKNRDILDEQMIQDFKIGFCTGDGAIVFKEHRSFLRKELEIFAPNYHENFKNCIIFPIFDIEGNVTEIYGRKSNDFQGRKSHFYNKGGHKSIFNINNVSNSETVILAECIIDALSIYKAGFKNVTALFGANGFTNELESLCNNGIVKEVVLSLDNDIAGKKTTEKLLKKLSYLKIKIANLPEGIKDFNELLISQGIKSIIKVIDNASEQEPEAEKPSDRFSFENNHLIYKRDDTLYIIKNVLTLKNIEQSLRLIITAKYKNQTYTDRIDFYLSRSRKGFETSICKQFNLQPAIVESDLLEILVYIEADYRKRKEEANQPEINEMSEIDKSEAMLFLKHRHLLKEVKRNLEILGYVGEDANKLLLYLCGTSRKQNKPLNILIRSQSSSGKSFLIDTICSLMPAEDVHILTSLSPQALYYMPDDGLKHKFIAIDEKHGADDVEYPIRSLQSGGKLSRAVPIKNPSTGLTQTEYVTKEGPISYVDGSTDTSTNPENANRCYEIFLDESHVQTKAVQNEQKKAYTLDSLMLLEKKVEIRRKHQNAQRLLKKIKVVIPYVYLIEFPYEWTRNRRDHDRFLSLISTITFLHQYQRPIKKHNGVEYIESTIFDYEVAYKIASSVLFNTFQELEKPLFDFYLQLQEMVKKQAEKHGIESSQYWFTRKDVRHNLKIEDYLIKRFMRQLKDLEYFAVKSVGNGSRDRYKLVMKIKKDVILQGLTTPDVLRHTLNMKNRDKDK